MKKVVLIEDRPNRQLDFTRKLNCNLNKIEILKNICGGQELIQYRELIVSNDFTKLKPFDVIIIHRSALNTMDRLKLIDFVKTQAKTLVFFSGGISSISLQKLGSGNLLTINSKNIYSSNLISYLNDGATNILKLAFGEYWKINLEVSLLDKLVLYLYNYTPKPLPIVFSELKISDWLREVYFSEMKGLIKVEQLESVIDQLKISLSKSI